MTIETRIKNCKIGTIIYYNKQRLVKINDTDFANENIILKTESIVKSIINITKIIEPTQTTSTQNRILLNYEERIYLKNVIKPFRNRVYMIVKEKYNKYDNINIKLLNDETNEIEDFKLPKFYENTIFQNLEYYKEYTLKELYL